MSTGVTLREGFSVITVEQAVQNGIALLDAKGPKDWREIVEVEDLDVASIGWCVLGQIYGDYSRGMMELFDYEEEHWEPLGIKYGFEAQVNIHNEYGRDYEPLTAEWVRALSEV